MGFIYLSFWYLLVVVMVMVVLLYAGFRRCDDDSLVEWARFTSVELVYRVNRVWLWHIKMVLYGCYWRRRKENNGGIVLRMGQVPRLLGIICLFFYSITHLSVFPLCRPRGTDLPSGVVSKYPAVIVRAGGIVYVAGCLVDRVSYSVSLHVMADGV